MRTKEILKMLEKNGFEVLKRANDHTYYYLAGKVVMIGNHDIQPRFVVRIVRNAVRAKQREKKASTV